MENPKKVLIVGAGIAGCFLALLLARKKYDVLLVEKLSRNDALKAASKRSYNITLYGFALMILKENNLLKSLKGHLIPLKGSYTYLPHSPQPIFSKTSKKAPYFAVSRAKLLSQLIDQATKSKCIKVQFDTELLTVNKTTKTVIIRQNKRKKKLRVDYLIGCDGVNSTVRSFLQQEKGATLSKEYSKWSYRQIKFTEVVCRKLNLKRNFAYTWSSKELLIASFPNSNRTITAMLIAPIKKNVNSKMVTDLFPSLSGIDRVIDKSIQDSPLGTFVTIHTKPWHYKDFIVILGDAAHGFNPFFGQGVSAALGDCVSLVKHLEHTKNPFQAFELERKVHMDTLGELSKKGFELYRREKRAEFSVVYDKILSILNRMFPFFVPPVFELIAVDPGNAFTHVKRYDAQKKVLSKLGIVAVLAKLTQFIDLYDTIRAKLQEGPHRSGRTGLKVN